MSLLCELYMTGLGLRHANVRLVIRCLRHHMLTSIYVKYRYLHGSTLDRKIIAVETEPVHVQYQPLLAPFTRIAQKCRLNVGCGHTHSRHRTHSIDTQPRPRARHHTFE